MAAFQSKLSVKKYKGRLQSKLEEVVDEADSLSSLINEEISKIQKVVQSVQDNNSESFFGAYDEARKVLDRFSEKLFLLNTILDDSNETAAFDKEKAIECDEDDDDASKIVNCEPCKSQQELRDEATNCLSPCDRPAVTQAASQSLLQPENVPMILPIQAKLSLSSDASSASGGNRIKSYFEDPNQEGVNAAAPSSVSLANIVPGGPSLNSSFYSICSPSKESLVESLCLSPSAIPSEPENQLPVVQESVCDELNVSFHSMRSSNIIDAAQYLSRTIPSPQVEIGSCVQAIITEFQTPSKFWMQLWDTNNALTPSFKFESCAIIEPSEIYVNQYCLAPLEDNNVPDISSYQRARVEQIFGLAENMTVSLFYVDFGRTKLLNSCSLREMSDSFFSQPARAISCYLNGVAPMDYKWSAEANEEFLKTIQNFDPEMLIVSEADGRYAVDFKVQIPDDIMCDMSEMFVIKSYAISTLDVQSTSMNDTIVADNCKESSFSPDVKIGVSGLHTETFDTVTRSSNADSECEDLFESDESDDVDLSCSRIRYASVNNACSNTFQPQTYFHDECEDLERPMQRSSGAEFELQDLPVKKAIEDKIRNSEQNYVFSSSPLLTFESHNKSSKCLVPKMSDTGPSKNFNQIEMCEFDWSVQIPFPSPEPMYSKENHMLVLCAAICSPGEFYVNPACENALDLDSIREQMSVFYNDEKNTIGLKVDAKDLNIGACYSSKYTPDQSWYRVRVVKVYNANSPQAQALVQYVDYGNSCTVDVATLKPLTKVFSKYPAFAFLCTMAHVTPRRRDCDGFPYWDEFSIKEFIAIVGFNKFYTAEVVEKIQSADKGVTLSVRLWDTSDSGEILINQILIDRGLADAQADAQIEDSSSEEPTDESHVLSEWDPMAEAYKSVLNSYKVSGTDVGMALDGYIRKDDQFICKHFSTTGFCRRRNCNYEHIRIGDDDVTREVDIVRSVTFDTEVPLPRVNSTVLGQLSSVDTPSHFYLVFPYGVTCVSQINHEGSGQKDDLGEFDALKIAMNSHYDNSEFDELTTLALPYGSIVAAKDRATDMWWRARVIDVVDVDKPVKVFFVDSGNTDWVERVWIRELKQEFLHTPHQAVECFLSNVQPRNYDNGGKWTTNAMCAFKTLMAGKMLLVHVDNRISSTLHVSLGWAEKAGMCTVNKLIVQGGYGEYANNCDEAKLEKLRNSMLADQRSAYQPG